MTRALLIHCHPRPESFTAAVRDTVLTTLAAKGAETRLTDLYAEGFDPALTASEHETYETADHTHVARHAANIAWADTLIFTYPTWWYGLPAMLKGWLDRTMLPGLAFHMPAGPNETIRPGLTHITRLGVFTTCGASRTLTFLMGAPGKRTLLRGIGALCTRTRRTAFAAHYLMDSSTPQSRAAHLARVARKTERLIR